MSDRDMDRLVDAIAERVKAQLTGQAPPAGHSHGHGHGGADKPCRAGKHECTGCGWSARRRPGDVRLIVDNGAARVGAAPDIGAVDADLAHTIDHTLLKADATRDQLTKLCDEARRYQFATVCVNPANVRYCAGQLRGSGVGVCTVVGFPLGATVARTKAYEAREAIRDGATEIDMVINIGALKSRDYATVLEDIQAVVEASRPQRVKVILETGGLDQEQKIIACALSKVAGAAFVKTSTGFGPGGATVEDVRLMRQVVGGEMEVKASGGVRTTDDAKKMLEAGATRIGASASVAIVTGTSDEKKGKDGRGKVTPLRRVVGGY